MRLKQNIPFIWLRKTNIKMAPKFDWDELMHTDPEFLPGQEELASKLLESLSKLEDNELAQDDPNKLIHLFKITRTLLKMKTQEVDLAMEELEKAGEEQAKTGN
ncbi:centrosomal protein of 290 kDa-like [Erpetoichthys calabaricus]|uniref:centrosomal protein of 290 kDa-like n=1 Tax=Erpetoichthys calabaricus TaxID=27687 RepID=UPI002234AD4F|nr:centrosomal protein of 290 kDa-like [Erpetoichthys calabaricus]